MMDGGTLFPTPRSGREVNFLRKLAALTLVVLFVLAVVSTSAAASKPSKFRITPYHWVKLPR